MAALLPQGDLPRSPGDLLSWVPGKALARREPRLQGLDCRARCGSSSDRMPTRATCTQAGVAFSKVSPDRCGLPP